MRKSHVWTLKQSRHLYRNYKGNPQHFADKWGISIDAVMSKYQWLRRRNGKVKETKGFTKDQIAFILKNWEAMTYPELSKGIGKPCDSIESQVVKLRKDGYNLPYKVKRTVRNPTPIGTIHILNNGKKTIKTKKGWRYLKKEKKPKIKPEPKKKKAVYVLKPKPSKKIITSAIRTQKKVVKQEKKLRLQSTESGGT